MMAVIRNAFAKKAEVEWKNGDVGKNATKYLGKHY